MAMKIYGLPMSTCTVRVLAAAIEKDAPYVIQPVDVFTGEHKKPEFLALQPFGQIPVLQDGDLHLFESRAIIRYIATKFKEQGTTELYGRTPQEHAKVEQWLEVEGQNFNPPISIVVAQLVFRPKFGVATDEAIVEENIQKLAKVLDVYDGHLASKPYLAGDFFSLADLSHLPYLFYLIEVAQRGEVVKSRKNVFTWWERISSRPNWKKTIDVAMQPMQKD